MKPFKETFNREMTKEDVDIQCYALEMLLNTYDTQVITRDDIIDVIDIGRNIVKVELNLK